MIPFAETVLPGMRRGPLYAANGSAGGAASAVRAGAAYVELFVKNNKLTRGLDAAKKQVESFGKATSSIGKSLFGLGASAFAPMALAIRSLSQASDISDTAAAFGLTAEEASRLFGIMQSSGSELRDATEGLVTFGQRVKDAIAGTGEESVKFFDRLGVAATEFEGLNPAQQFYKMMEAIKKVEDPATRVQLLLKAVGEDTGKNLIKLLGKTDDELQRIGDAAEMTGDELRAASTATKAWNGAMAMLARAWDKVAIALAPTIAEASQAIVRFADRAARVIRDCAPLVPLFAKAALGIVAAGAALYGVGLAAGAVVAGITLASGAVAVLTSGISAIAAVVGFVFTPFGAALAAVAAAVALLAYQTWPDLKAAFLDAAGPIMDGIGQIGETFNTTIGGIAEALKNGDLAAAMKVAMAGVNLAWLQGLQAMNKAWETTPIGMYFSQMALEQKIRDDAKAAADAAKAAAPEGGAANVPDAPSGNPWTSPFRKITKYTKWLAGAGLVGDAILDEIDATVDAVSGERASRAEFNRRAAAAGKPNFGEVKSPEIIAAEAALLKATEEVRRAKVVVEQGPEPRAMEAGPKPREVGAATGKVWEMVREIGMQAAAAQKAAAAGTFSGRNVSQRLGYGGTVLESINKNGVKQIEAIVDVREAVEKIPPVKFN